MGKVRELEEGRKRELGVVCKIKKTIFKAIKFLKKEGKVSKSK